MKHAYLIIAHNQFDLLQLLISLIDDVRNDIFLHIDKKITTIPDIKTCHSKLFILENRINIHWGSISQIETELLLFSYAYKKGDYKYFHLISGTTLPLKSQDYLHDYFNNACGNSIVQLMDTNDSEIKLKLLTKHYFLKWYKHDLVYFRRFVQLLWRRLCMIQHFFKEPIIKDEYIKASNWLSLSDIAVKALLSTQDCIMKEFNKSFCGDEFFVVTTLKRSGIKYICSNSYIKTNFFNENPRILSPSDYGMLLNSQYLFARKFSEKDLTELCNCTFSIMK